MSPWKIGMLAVCAILCGISLQSLAQTKLLRSTRDPEEIRLRLIFARKERSLIAANADPEEMRMAMADLREQYAEAFTQLSKRQATQEVKRVYPTTMPLRAGRSAADFIQAGNAYLEGVMARSVEAAGGDLELARMRNYEATTSPSVVALKNSLGAAAQELAATRPPAPPPLADAQIAALPLKARLEAQIYKARYEATETPLAEGEEFRDRLAEVTRLVDAAQAEANKTAKADSLSSLDKNISDLVKEQLSQK